MKKVLIIIIVSILILLAIGAGVFVLLRPKPQVKSQAEILKDQIWEIDAEYGQKIVEVVGKQKENSCIAEKDVEVTVTLTGEKKIEKQWKTVSTGEV